MRIRKLLLTCTLVAAGTALGAAEAGAAGPVLLGVGESEAPAGGGRVLMVFGSGVSKYKTMTLADIGGTDISPLTILVKSKNILMLQLPASFDRPTYTLPGDYMLKYSWGKVTGTVNVRITLGYPEPTTVDASALVATLRTDLDDAATVGGETAASLHAWSQLTGMPAGFADGVDDGATYLAGSGLLLTGTTFSVNNGLYYLQTQLNAAGGTINSASNPVDWSRLKGVPAGFADGIDDGGGGSYSAGAGLTLTGTVFAANFGGNGAATSVSRSDHDHNALYYLQTQLNAAGGTINTASNPVDWSRLKGVPAAFADGTDDGGSFSAGNGLTLTGTVFAANFAGTGAANTVARSDHNHTGTYLPLAGGSMTGAITMSTSGASITATSGNTSSSAGGIDCTSANGVGVAGHGNIGVLGDLDSSGSNGVEGRCGYSYQNGMYAYANSGYGDPSSTALFAYHYWGGVGVKGKSYSGIGVYGYSIYQSPYYPSIGVRGASGAGYGTGVQALLGGSNGIALHAVNYGNYCTGLLVDQQGSGGEMAVFMRYGSYNVARISNKGVGYFNGGLYNYGADFAESVKTVLPASEFEPGDVMVIDPSEPRHFMLSSTAESTLVAGVVSTRPALVGNTRKVAGERRTWGAEEVKLGIVGIVPTKVCDEGGAIRIGDLLVTSSIPGHAKKAPANPAVGTVVGKALGALPAGQGKVEVLLMAR